MPLATGIYLFVQTTQPEGDTGERNPSRALVHGWPPFSDCSLLQNGERLAFNCIPIQTTRPVHLKDRPAFPSFL